eukprot:COSAG02_NODE_37_length_48203_cov_57.745708_19_plen_137_part_00
MPVDCGAFASNSALNSKALVVGRSRQMVVTTTQRYGLGTRGASHYMLMDMKTSRQPLERAEARELVSDRIERGCTRSSSTQHPAGAPFSNGLVLSSLRHPHVVDVVMRGKHRGGVWLSWPTPTHCRVEHHEVVVLG